MIVDDQGRPLVTNRPSWVISVDRTMLGKMSDRQRSRLLARLGRAVGEPAARIDKRLVTCGDPGSIAGTCWNGSPYQPIPITDEAPLTERSPLARAASYSDSVIGLR